MTYYYDPDQVIPNILSEEEAQQLTADSAGGEINTDIITEECENATEHINSKAGRVYEVPFESIPKSIRRAAKTIVGYFLWNRRLSAGMTNPYQDAFDRVEKWLDQIAAGKAVIDGEVRGTTNTKRTGGKVSGNDRTFTKDSMKGL